MLFVIVLRHRVRRLWLFPIFMASGGVVASNVGGVCVAALENYRRWSGGRWVFLMATGVCVEGARWFVVIEGCAEESEVGGGWTVVVVAAVGLWSAAMMWLRWWHDEGRQRRSSRLSARSVVVGWSICWRRKDIWVVRFGDFGVSVKTKVVRRWFRVGVVVEGFRCRLCCGWGTDDEVEKMKRKSFEWGLLREGVRSFQISLLSFCSASLREREMWVLWL